MRILQAVWCAIVVAMGASSALAQNAFLPVEEDRDALISIIGSERPSHDVPSGVTGITVPHHLLAADLIARGFWAASSGNYDRVILLAPDHFRQVDTGFAVDASDHETILGPIAGDRIAATLLEEAGVPPHPNIASEHGVGALLPFIAHFMPNVPVMSVVSAVQSTPEEWEEMAALLEPLISPDTLVVQSTDYSHFLPLEQALTADMQTLAVIAGQDAEVIKSLTQPDHLDSLAAQFVQMRLQSSVFGASEAVVAHGVSTDYGGTPDDVTSYLVTVYHPEPTVLSVFDYSDQARLFFGGDVLTGRFLGPVLADARARASILNSMSDILRGTPLVVNLEGTIVDGTVGNAPAGAHLMSGVTAPGLLRLLGVTGASLANNHAFDFGEGAAEETAKLLEAAGIKALRPGRVVDLGPLRVVALNLLKGSDPWVSDLAGLCALDAEPPLVAFVHWGEEYTGRATAIENGLADQAAACGVSAVIGAHTHLASGKVTLSPAGLPFVYSLGNLLFDQTSARASGAVAELRVFKHGTVALRLIPIPNLFEVGREALAE